MGCFPGEKPLGNNPSAGAPVLPVLEIEAECVPEIRMGENLRGRAGANDAAVEKNDAVGNRHDPGEIVRDHQNREIKAVPEIGDGAIEKFATR